MGRIVVTEFISLDGVIEDPGGTEGYVHGGWTFQFNAGPEFEFTRLEIALAVIDERDIVGAGLQHARCGDNELPSGGTWQVTISAQQNGKTVATKQLNLSATGGM